METRTLAENGTPVTKEKTVAFSGHRTNRIAKFTADREKLFREVAFDTFVAIESYCIKKGYHTFLSGNVRGLRPYRSRGSLEPQKGIPAYPFEMRSPLQGTSRAVHPGRQAAL